ncbi:MAG TPA: preprotein translocase subunit SecE [Anaerolineaceae bacterium]|nr:preprotein translocase subunit SecE [Anaerolineaceae bacterium]
MAEKVEKRREPGRLVQFYRETVGELRKVTWPTPQEAWYLTRVVLVVLFVMATLLGALDFLFSRMITMILS